MEGSMVIVLGSILLSISTLISKNALKNWYFVSSFMIIFGVFFLFYFSYLGGFGGESKLSWWWTSFIAPYPLGWLLAIVLLILEMRKKKPA